MLVSAGYPPFLARGEELQIQKLFQKEDHPAQLFPNLLPIEFLLGARHGAKMISFSFHHNYFYRWED